MPADKKTVSRKMTPLTIGGYKAHKAFLQADTLFACLAPRSCRRGGSNGFLEGIYPLSPQIADSKHFTTHYPTPLQQRRGFSVCLAGGMYYHFDTTHYY